MASEYGYCADFVVCIDATARMAPIIEQVKVNAMSVLLKYTQNMQRADKKIKALRVKVITFRNFRCDEPMTESPFFKIPKQMEELKAFLNGIEAKGGVGREVSVNALEALALAIKSDWTTRGEHRRQAILMYSNNYICQLCPCSSSPPNYPKDMPVNYDEVQEWWDGIIKVNKAFCPKDSRLLVFAQYTYPWTEMNMHWRRFWMAGCHAGIGVSEESLQAAIDLLVE